MNIKLFLSSIAVFVIVVSALPTSPANAQAKDRPTAESTENLDVQVARVYLSLAKMDLGRALDANRKSPKFYPDILIERLRGNVGIAEVQLKLALKEGDTKLHDVHIRSAQAAVSIAESNEKNLRALSRSLPSESIVLDHKRSQLALQLAKLRLQRALDPKSTESPLVHLQWQVDQLSEQVLELSVNATLQHSGR